MADTQYARFETMTNVELRAELKRRGCPTSGNKKDLLAKLRASLQIEYEQNQTPVVPVAQQLVVPPVVDNQETVLETSNNVNEVNSFVSKSNETDEKEKNIEKIGDHTPLPVIVDSSKSQTETSESNVEENTSDDKPQQSANQSQVEIENREEPIETTKETESLPAPEKPSRSQSNASVKFPIRPMLNKINLNLDVLRTLIADVSLLSESAANDELDSDQNNDSTFETSLTNDFQPTDSMTIGELADQKPTSNRTVAIDEFSTRKPVRMASFEGKTNGLVADEPVRVKQPSVANEPPSEILYIRGLTRPFSLMQLKELLSRYGTLVDGDFWLDKIKSQCFVHYKTIEDAQNARQELDGCRWPLTNPKILFIRFARQDEMEHSKTHDAPPDHVSNEDSPTIDEYTNDSKPLKEKQSGFLITDDDDDEENIDEQPAVKPNDQSAKGLDDYFRKTKAKPSIYWLPLTEEQIVERNRRQEQRKAERDEEYRKREFDENQRRNDKRKRSISPSRRDGKRY